VNNPLLLLKGVYTYFYTNYGVVKAITGVDFKINKKETLGVVGESGCGKSVTALSILRLIPKHLGKTIKGEIQFCGENLLEKSEAEMRRIRGNDISMIFQEPMTSLNPVLTIGNQIAEVVQVHKGKSKKEAISLAIEMLYKVDVPLPEQRVYEYPHQLSGGMRQRVMIAMALLCGPKLLIADEPTTALDVTIQAQILNLMRELRDDFGTTIILITHNLGVIAELATQVVVMYAGKVVESADVRTLFKKPAHPYTCGLINSIPKLTEERRRLMTIEGAVPDVRNLPEGCSFLPRCKFAKNICHKLKPEMKEITEGHKVRCFFPIIDR